MSLTSTHIQRYADVLVWGLTTARRKPFKRGDAVLIRYQAPALAVAEALFARLIDKGFNPIQRQEFTPAMEQSLFCKADQRQLVFLAPGENELYGRIQGSITVQAPASLTHLVKADPRRFAALALSRKPIKDILADREAKGLYGWTLGGYPTQAQADQAGLDIDTYSRQVVKACFLNRRDPVARWQEIFNHVGQIKRRLDSLAIEKVHVESQRIDLVVTVGRMRRWLGISGRNIPSFEIFLSPDWRGTHGTYHADQPSLRSGNRVAGISLTFARGQLTEIEAEQGEDFLRQQLAMDPGAGRIGEFSLTDRRFSPIDRFMANTLYDENHGGRHGNCHIALGSSYTTSFSGNPADLTAGEKKRLGFNDSALHWDLVNTQDKRVTAHLTGGGKTVIYDNGRFID